MGIDGGTGAMRYDWMDAYLLSKTAVEKDLQPDWNWIRYKIGGKMFAAILLDDDDKPYYINLKLEPTEGEFLRGQYPDIIPGYYSDKRAKCRTSCSVRCWTSPTIWCSKASARKSSGRYWARTLARRSPRWRMNAMAFDLLQCLL